MTTSDVFLTGATGYVGWSVLEHLAGSGRSVTALVREPIELPGARTVVGELNVLQELAGDVGSCASIVHLASGRSNDRAHVVYQDILGMGQLLDSWQQGPFVYTSAATIHGAPHAVLEASSPIEFNDWHHAGKAVNEFQLRETATAGASGRGAGVSLRPGLYFGRSHRPPYRQILNSFFFHAQAGHTFTADTDDAADAAGVSFVGDHDYGRAVVASLDRGNTGEYPVASGFASYRDIVQTINRVAGTKGAWAVRPPRGDTDMRVPHSRIEIDSSAFSAQTGWRAQQGLEEVVTAFVDGEREAGRA